MAIACGLDELVRKFKNNLKMKFQLLSVLLLFYHFLFVSLRCYGRKILIKYCCSHIHFKFSTIQILSIYSLPFMVDCWNPWVNMILSLHRPQWRVVWMLYLSPISILENLGKKMNSEIWISKFIEKIYLLSKVFNNKLRYGAVDTRASHTDRTKRYDRMTRSDRTDCIYDRNSCGL